MKKRSIWNNRTLQRLHSLFMQLTIMIWSFFILICIEIVFRIFISKKIKPLIWRTATAWGLKKVYWLFGIKIDIPKKIHTKLESLGTVVLVSNHPSAFDGFTYHIPFAPNLVVLTQPFGDFPFPLNYMMKYLDFVDVLRDEYDVRHAKKANDKDTAITKLVEHLNKKHDCVLIFPEGHLQRLHIMHHVHTGAARVAAEAGKPLLPVALKNVHHVFMDGSHSRPGTIHVEMGKPIRPPKKHQVTKTKIRTMSEKIEKQLRGMLHSRNIYVDINDRAPHKIGVFLDIDHTLYKGQSQIDFAKYLVKHRHISSATLYKGLFYYVLNKIGLMSHREMMTRVLSFTKDWTKDNLERMAADFFDEHVIERLEHHILPIAYDHYKNGHTIFLVTEVIEPLAKQFAQYFHAKDFRGTVIIKKEGIMTGEIKRLCWSEEKALQVKALAKKHNINLKKSYAYADSDEDIPMLKLVKHKIVINPKPKLLEKAKKNGWHHLH